MKLNDYINQSKYLVNLSKKTKIAFLSNFTTLGLPEVMKVLSHQQGVFAETFSAPYNQYVQEIADSESQLYQFSPEIIFLLLDKTPLLEDFLERCYRITPEERKQFIENKFSEIRHLVEIIKENSSAKVILNNLTIPYFSSKGILEHKEIWGLRKSIHYFNDLLGSLADSQLFIFDFNLFSSNIGYQTLTENKMNYLADMRISPEALVELSKEYMAYIFPLKSLTKKCLVLDLDNTLWGGVIGEEGLSKIKLGPDNEGRPFLEFQKMILQLVERGIILAINSKNNFDDVKEVFEKHPYMILKEKHFASMRINWQDKATNLREIAQELNIGLDSLVFIDDDKTNCELVRQFVPEVKVIELPKDPSLYPKVIENLNCFNSFNITQDDLKKGEMYINQIQRKTFESSFTDTESFLQQLSIKLSINDGDELNTPRISQLTQKTNQFNLTTKRYLEEDIKKHIDSEDSLIKYIKVQDKFGDYGTTGVVVVSKSENIWEIDTFLLSCRVLGKNIEFSIMDQLIQEAKNAGIQKIKGRFIPTKKNLPAKNFLLDCGFELQDSMGEEQNYALLLGNERRRDLNYIEVI